MRQARGLLQICCFSFIVAGLAGAMLLFEPVWNAASTSHAQTTFNVGGACTLEQAINAANANTDCDGQTASGPPYTIVLQNTTYDYSDGNFSEEGNNALPPIDTEIIIQGNGAVIERDPSLTCPGLNGGNFRLFFIDTDGALTLDNVTVRNGCEARGGGIYNQGSLTLTHSAVLSNTATVPDQETNNRGQGGGVFATDGATTYVADSHIQYNRAIGGGGTQGGRGGGIYQDDGVLTVTDSHLSHNEAHGGDFANIDFDAGRSGRGGAIFARNEAEVLLTGSYVTHNRAVGGEAHNSGRGGGIYADNEANVAIRHSHILSNTAQAGDANDSGHGGGVFQRDGYLTIEDSHILYNAAHALENTEGFSFFNGLGGGIFAERQVTVTVNSSQVSHNRARGDTGFFSGGGGGIFTYFDPSEFDEQESEALHSPPVLAIIDSYLEGNLAEGGGFSSGYGGGLYHEAGALTILNTIIADNTARNEGALGGWGGGVFTRGLSQFPVLRILEQNDELAQADVPPMSIIDATIRGNRAEGDGFSSGHGGGIYHEIGNLDIINSQIVSNTAQSADIFGGHGGGLYAGTFSSLVLASESNGLNDLNGLNDIHFNPATITISDTTIRDNFAYGEASDSGWGGGIYHGDGSLAITSSYILSNTAQGGDGEGSGVGGGIFTYADNALAGSALILAYNRASNTGGALYSSEGFIFLSDSEALASEMEETVNIVQSCIMGNSDTAVHNAAEALIWTQSNWWGAPDGPSGQGPGFGDSVSDAVEFEPWLATPPSICPDLRFETTLALTKNVEPSGPLLPGQPLTYTLRYTNTGDVPAYSARLTDTLPAALTGVSFSADPSVADTGVTPPYAFVLGDVAPDATGIIVLTGRVNEALTANLTFSNQAAIAADNAAASNSQPVTNDVNLPALNFSQAAYSVGEAGGSASITVVLAPINPHAPVTVTVATQDGSALAGTDYTAVVQTLVFPPGVAQQSFHVPILDNDVAEGDRSLSLLLQSAVGALAGPPAVLTIVDDNEAGIGGVGDNESGTATYFLASRPTAPVHLQITPENPDLCHVEPGQITIAPDDWQTGATVHVTAVSGDGAPIDCVLLATATSDDPNYDGADVPQVVVTVPTPQTPGLVFTVGLSEQGGAPCQDAPAALTVHAGTAVLFCFTVQNTGSARLINHTLAGNLTGPIAIQADLVLEPGASYSHTLTRTVTVSETHTFVWHAQAEPTAQPTGEVAAAQAVDVTREAQAIIEIEQPTNLPPNQQPGPHLRRLFIPSVTQD